MRIIRDSTLFLAGLSLLFTLVLTITSLAHEQPSLEKVEAMSFLQTMPEYEVVLSSAENGIFIERIGRRQAFLDEVTHDTERFEIANQVFSSQKMGVARELLVANNISHIVIDDEMRNGNIWTNDDQGLLFLVDNNPSFIRVYDKGGVSVYRFVK